MATDPCHRLLSNAFGVPQVLFSPFGIDPPSTATRSNIIARSRAAHPGKSLFELERSIGCGRLKVVKVAGVGVVPHQTSPMNRTRFDRRLWYQSRRLSSRHNP